MIGRLGVAMVAAFVATAAPAQRHTLGVPQGDDLERSKPIDATLELPASSRAQQPVEVTGFATRGNRYLVEPGSLAVSRDGEVRFTLFVRSPSGIDNATYVGLRCTRRQYRNYATGATDGSWIPAPQTTEWQPVPVRASNHPSAVLFEDYFCPKGLPLRDAAEGAAALRAGSNPRAGYAAP